MNLLWHYVTRKMLKYLILATILHGVVYASPLQIHSKLIGIYFAGIIMYVAASFYYMFIIHRRFTMGVPATEILSASFLGMLLFSLINITFIYTNWQVLVTGAFPIPWHAHITTMAYSYAGAMFLAAAFEGSRK